LPDQIDRIEHQRCPDAQKGQAYTLREGWLA